MSNNNNGLKNAPKARDVLNNIENQEVNNTYEENQVPVQEEQVVQENNVIEKPINENFVSTEANNTFFEKFEKSRKDIAKDKRERSLEAKKSLNLKGKMLGFDNKLRDDAFVKKFWIGFILAGLLFFAYACVVISFLGPQFNGATSDKWSYVNWYGDMNKTIVIFSGVVVGLIPIPYVYLIASWFVGINNVWRSKSFFVVNLTFLSICAVLVLLILPMSSVIFGYVNNFSPIISGGAA